MKHKYIVIEGNIGAGKTSLSRLLAQNLNTNLVLEQFADNPFLPLFYENPERYALSVELFFMTERHQKLQTFLEQTQEAATISDYIFSKTLLFASQTLKGEEFKLFQRLFTSLNNTFPQPDLVVFLNRPIEELLANIKKRNRTYEQQISGEYLGQIQESYLNFFENQPHDFPILILDTSQTDFVQNPSDYEKIAKLIMQPYEKGLHYRSLSTIEAG